VGVGDRACAGCARGAHVELRHPFRAPVTSDRV
jgi:hypothetical protein